MKALKFLVALTVLLSFSCSSDDDSGAPSNNELILGKWQWTASTSDGTPVELDECELQDTLEFKADGEVTSVSHNGVISIEDGTLECVASATVDAEYTIDGNVITVEIGTSSNEGTIVTLNATTLTVSYTYEDNDGGEVTTVVDTDTYTKI